MNVTGSRRHVDEQEVQDAPANLQNHLFQGVACHGTAPDKRLVGCGEIADRHPFHPIFFDGEDDLGAIFLFQGSGDGSLRVCHQGNGRAIDIGIGQTHAVAQAGQGDGQVDGHGGFAHAALAGGNADDVPHVVQLVQREVIHVGLFRGRRLLFHHGLYIYLRAGRGPAVQGRPGTSHQVFRQRVPPFGKAEGYVYGLVGQGNLRHHTQFHNAFVAFRGVAHLGEQGQYLFLCHYFTSSNSSIIWLAPPSLSTRKRT